MPLKLALSSTHNVDECVVPVGGLTLLSFQLGLMFSEKTMVTTLGDWSVRRLANGSEMSVPLTVIVLSAKSGVLPTFFVAVGNVLAGSLTLPWLSTASAVIVSLPSLSALTSM